MDTVDIGIADVRIAPFHPRLGGRIAVGPEHPWHEAIYVEAGHYSLAAPPDAIRVEPGSLVVIPAGTEHRSRSPRDLATRLWILQWTGWLPPAWNRPVVLADPDRRVHAALGWMRDRQDDLPRDAAGGCRRFIDHLALALLHELACRHRGLLTPADPVARARDILWHSPENNWTLHELALHVGMTPEHLCRRFSRRYGEPPLAWVTRLRVERAVARLRAGPATLAEVAAAVGFGSAGGLAKAIKRLTGTTARAIRGGAKLPSR